MVRISASRVMLKILEADHVKQIYGYPAGSVNSLMNALQHEKDHLQYIQVRHEQVGALAASAQAKLTGQLGVAFGSAGPGAVNMLDGLYDAKLDHAPVLAIIGQADSEKLNYHYFQAMPEQTAFHDVACYDRIVLNAASLPHITERAIRMAYHYRSVAVIILPNNLGFRKIQFTNYHPQLFSKKQERLSLPSHMIISRFLQMVKLAHRPIFHVGAGINRAGTLLIKLAHRLQIPVVADGPAKSLIPVPIAVLGTSNHDVSKVANELFDLADLVIAIDPNNSFSPSYYRQHHARLIQIESDPQRLGCYRQPDLGIWANPNDLIEQLLKASHPVKFRPFFKASVLDLNNWYRYLLQQRTRNGDPITPAQVYQQIDRIANTRALFSVDIGDNLINSLRYLHLTPQNRLLYSVQFGTMGCSLPGAIAAQLVNPRRQVFSIAGDGAFSMIMQDLITLRKYRLPVINVITSNGTTNYIRGKQSDLALDDFGNRLVTQDFAMIAKAMGIQAIDVDHYSELSGAFDLAKEIAQNGKPFLINIKITPRRDLPVENLRIDRRSLTEGYQFHGQVSHHLRSFFNRYRGQSLHSLSYFMKKLDYHNL